jgi:hypothetical protein
MNVILYVAARRSKPIIILNKSPSPSPRSADRDSGVASEKKSGTVTIYFIKAFFIYPKISMTDSKKANTNGVLHLLEEGK